MLETVALFLNLSPILPLTVIAVVCVSQTDDATLAAVSTAVPTVLSTAMPTATWLADGIAHVPVLAPKLYDVPNLTSDAAGRPNNALLGSTNVLVPPVSVAVVMKLFDPDLSLQKPDHGCVPLDAYMADSNDPVPVASVLLMPAANRDATAVVTRAAPVDVFVTPNDVDVLPPVAEPEMFTVPVLVFDIPVIFADDPPITEPVIFITPVDVLPAPAVKLCAPPIPVTYPIILTVAAP